MVVVSYHLNALYVNSQASDSCTFECWLWVSDLNSARNIFDLGNLEELLVYKQMDRLEFIQETFQIIWNTNNPVSTQD